MNKLSTAGLFLSACLLASCGSVSAVKATASNATEGLKKISLPSIPSLRPDRVDVVEVREKDLKEMPSGKDLALAFEEEKKRTFWSFTLPDFKEPSLPSISDEAIDGSLLPPKPL